MEIKAIVSDFDGTLVGADRQISSNAVSAIKTFLNSGGIFSIATGRAFEGLVEKSCLDLGLSGYHIVRGGSEIIDGKSGKVVWGKYIKPALVTSIVDQFSKMPNISFLAESGKDLYTLDGKGNEEFATGALIKKISEIPLDKTPKIAIPPIFNKVITEPIYEALLKQYPQLHIVKTTSKKGMGVDINDGGAGKHIALLEYAKLTHIVPGEICGVGDSYNDYPLLSACGIKAAMGNAPDELKKLADFIVGTQENDGIVDVIKKALAS